MVKSRFTISSEKEADGGCLVFRIEYPVCCGRLGGEEKPRVLSYPHLAPPLASDMNSSDLLESEAVPMI